MAKNVILKEGGQLIFPATHISNVDGKATKAQAEGGTDNQFYMTALRTKEAIDKHATSDADKYMGTWNASTNIPDLTTVQVKGHYYLVLVAGNRFSIDWNVGDRIISNGTAWIKIPFIGSSDGKVTSVNGRTGDVVLTATDVGALGLNVAAADSNKLGGLAASEYYSSRNCNNLQTPWSCSTLTASGNITSGGIIQAKGEVVAYSTTNDVRIGGSTPENIALLDLTDVDLSVLLANQVLMYDVTSPAKWRNKYLTKSMIDLGNVNNTSDLDKPISTAQRAEFDSVRTLVTNHTGNTNNPHNTTKTHVGLGNVDNTSDVNKPISTAMQTALNGKLGKTEAAADSYKLGGIEASKYWHDANSGQLTYDWMCKTLYAASSVQTPISKSKVGEMYECGTPMVFAKFYYEQYLMELMFTNPESAKVYTNGEFEAEKSITSKDDVVAYKTSAKTFSDNEPDYISILIDKINGLEERIKILEGK